MQNLISPSPIEPLYGGRIQSLQLLVALALLLIPACGGDAFTTAPADPDENEGGAPTSNDDPDQDGNTGGSDSETPGDGDDPATGGTSSTGGAMSSGGDAASGGIDASGGTTSSGGTPSTGGTTSNGPPTCGSGNCPNWHDDFSISNAPEDGQCVSTVWNQVYEEWIFIGNSWDINCGPRSTGTYCWNNHDKHYGPRYVPCP